MVADGECLEAICGESARDLAGWLHPAHMCHLTLISSPWLIAVIGSGGVGSPLDQVAEVAAP